MALLAVSREGPLNARAKANAVFGAVRQDAGPDPGEPDGGVDDRSGPAQCARLVPWTTSCAYRAGAAVPACNDRPSLAHDASDFNKERARSMAKSESSTPSSSARQAIAIRPYRSSESSTPQRPSTRPSTELHRVPARAKRAPDLTRLLRRWAPRRWRCPSLWHALHFGWSGVPLRQNRRDLA